jgi:tyrosine-protein kinase Etk/Wzc
MTDTTATTRNEFQDDITISDILVALGQEKNTLITTTLVGICASLALALLLPRFYTARTVLLPPSQQSSSAASALAQLGAMGGGIAGLAAGVKTPDELYVALLKSRSVQDDLIAKFKLKQRYDTKLLETTRKKLAGNMVIATDKKTGLITVDADDKDPVFAAQLANAHADALRRMLGRIAVTDAQQKRQFLQEQVSKTQTAQNAAELKFRQAQAASGLVVSQALAEGGVRESAQLRGQIAAREVQLQTLSHFATPNHPDVQRVAAELAALRRQLTNIEQGSGTSSGQNASGMEAVQAFRDMKVQETLLQGLIAQLEMARADEAKEGPLLQQVDVAIAPEKPKKPKRSFVVIVGTIASFVLGLLLVALKLSLKKDDDSWRRVRAAWKFGRNKEQT